MKTNEKTHKNDHNNNITKIKFILKQFLLKIKTNSKY